MVDFCLKNFSFSYPDSSRKALDNINLSINSGEFVVISGKSGSGKSTLLSMLKPEISPYGKKEGVIYFFGKNADDFSQRESCEKIGFLLQNTEYQTVTHSVRTELAFGLENMGLASETIRLRIAEISAYFSLEKIINKKISELSGGQKQLVCLASILAMHPKAVIFDEPASQLDPTAAESFISTIKALCKDIGITVIITEHRLEGIIPEADRLIVLENGKIIADCNPSKLDTALFQSNSYIKNSMPFPMRLFAQLGHTENLPLNISDGRAKLQKALALSEKSIYPPKKNILQSKETALKMKDVYFAYDKTGYVLKGLDLKIPEGSFYALLGANSAGKSTALSLMSAILPLRSGRIEIFGKSIKKYRNEELYGKTLCLLPQKCESIFSCNSIEEELEKALSAKKLPKEEKAEKIKKIAELTNISALLSKHPYDVSGGEMQRAALAVALLKETKIILLDEPTKGMDALFKKDFAQIIKQLTSKGITVIMVSHDTEFCAENCDICAMLSDGVCVAETDARSFFAENLFYTTAANRLIRGFSEKAVGETEVIEFCRKNMIR